jgi:hypothetical protein
MAMAARMAMIATTIISSIKVKPFKVSRRCIGIPPVYDQERHFSYQANPRPEAGVTLLAFA